MLILHLHQVQFGSLILCQIYMLLLAHPDSLASEGKFSVILLSKDLVQLEGLYVKDITCVYLAIHRASENYQFCCTDSSNRSI